MITVQGYLITLNSYNLLTFKIQKMSLDDSQQQDCTVYIEELKSDNPSLKLNAASKISVIGSVLGHSRIRDELIPYLIEIIEQMDNDNDFLIKVSQGFLQLKQFCSGDAELSVIIHPLRILASLDQPPVRDEAINCLKKLVLGEAKEFYEKYYFPLIQQMSKSQLYAPRLTAACLIPSTYPHVTEESKLQLRQIFKTLALKENSPLVRRAVSQNIEQFATVVDKKIIRSDFYQIWQALIVDTFDIIRIKALECAVIIARTFKKEQTTQKFFKLIKFVDSEKKSWRIRYSLAQNLTTLLNYFEKDIVKKDVVEIYEELLKDQEAEIRAISLIKIPEVCQKLSPQQSWTVFFQYLQKASKDANKQSVPTAKLALVEAIVPYFKTVDKENIIETGLPILATLLKDENQSIRIGVMQKIMDLCDILGQENTAKHLVPMVEGCLNDKKWRFKLAIAESLPQFLKTLKFENHRDFIQKIVTIFLKDHNNAVREQTLKSLAQFRGLIGTENFFELVKKYYNMLSGEANYVYRSTSLMLLRNLGCLDKKELSEMFSTAIQKLEAEKVPNVLINFFHAYEKVEGNLTAQCKRECVQFSELIQREREDEDVIYFAQNIKQ